MKETSSCSCHKEQETEKSKSKPQSITWDRLEAAHKTAEVNLSKKTGSKKSIISDSQVQINDKGFCVASGAGNKNDVHVSFSGLRNQIPYNFTLSYDISVMHATNTVGNHKDIMWVEVSILEPFKRSVRIPLKAIGALRDSGTGSLVRLNGFEFVPSMSDDTKDALKLVLCILGCVGAACGWECWAPCMAGPAACIACVVACATAAGPELMECIEACHMATS